MPSGTPAPVMQRAERIDTSKAPVRWTGCDLDVKGRRLVIDACYMPGSTDEDRAEPAKVVSSIAFQP
jgi:hypothetical protein